MVSAVVSALIYFWSTVVIEMPTKRKFCVKQSTFCEEYRRSKRLSTQRVKNSLPALSRGAKLFLSRLSIGIGAINNQVYEERSRETSARTASVIGQTPAAHSELFRACFPASPLQINAETLPGDNELLVGLGDNQTHSSLERMSYNTALRGRKGSTAKVDQTWLFKTRYIGNDLYTPLRQSKSENIVMDFGNSKRKAVPYCSQLLQQFEDCKHVTHPVLEKTTSSILISCVPDSCNKPKKLHYLNMGAGNLLSRHGILVSREHRNINITSIQALLLTANVKGTFKTVDSFKLVHSEAGHKMFAFQSPYKIVLCPVECTVKTDRIPVSEKKCLSLDIIR